MGIAASGSSIGKAELIADENDTSNFELIGAIVFTILFQQLEPQVGFDWTTRIIAFVVLASLLLPIVAMRKRVSKSPRRTFVDLAAFREAPFIFMLCSMFFLFTGLYIPYFYIEVFSIQTQTLARSDRYLDKYLIVFLNVGSAIGRLVSSL